MKHISPKIWLAYLQKIKNDLKTDSVILDICKEYDMSVDDLDLVPIKFDDIDTSAKTEQGVITLNWNLLKSENKKQIPSYICHEFAHYCQQSTEPTQSADDGDYLHNDFEMEAFQFQVKFIDEEFGSDAADKYINQVLDHHNKTDKERKILKNRLEKKI